MSKTALRPVDEDVALSWQDRLCAVRDRWFQSPAFQLWVASFPLTRWKARREARAAFDICAGFVYAQIVTACVELRLFELVSERPRTTLEVSAAVAIPQASAETLLSAASALGLLSRRRGGRWGLTARGAALVGNAGLYDMIRHNRMLYEDLRDPVGLLRGQRRASGLADFWPYASADDPAMLKSSDVSAYSELMASSQRMISADILEAYPFERHGRLMDVGGGQGALLTAVAAKCPALKLSLFDLPAVAERARQQFAANGMEGRVEVHGGNFFADPLPLGADAISLVRIVHDHDDDAAMQLLRAVRVALPPGGVLILAEPMASTPGAEAMGDAYFGFYLLAMGSGRPRSAAQLAEMARTAGFREARLLRSPRPIMTQVLAAHA